MDTSRKICTVLTENDLSAGNIKSTVKWIENNSNQFYLLGWTNALWNIFEKLLKATTDEEKNNLKKMQEDDGLLFLWDTVEKLGKSIEDDNTLTKMRVAYNLQFDLQTVLRVGNEPDIEVKNFADLLECMDFDENLNLARADYHVIINDDNYLGDKAELANRAVAQLFQQTVFLNIVGLDIQKKSEIKKALIKERFRANYQTLREQIKSNKAYIEETLKDNKNLSAESVERAQKIIESFEAMFAEFDKAKARPIRIAAMGTKKAGKSVVINSLLKRDYAPTSSTLPTPNTIKYIPDAKDNTLTLDYDGKTYTFRTAEEISEFIGSEFKRAQKITGAGAGLPDMIIHYPCDELTGYEVWDTPGPNVAFTDEHRKNAEECIKEVDVCIFVMNYSNHLTNDEVNFLNQIHSIFQENDKFYSLFITVNRIDERYAVNEEKSVDRILDYISTRLEELKYKNVVVFGTSALQSFYLDSVIDLVKADRKEDGEDVDELPLIDASSVPVLKKKHKAAKTPIKFIDDALRNLEYFHDIDEGTEKELYALSGVPQLWTYTQYIGGSKADMEIVNNVVFKCELEFEKVNNSLLVTDLLELSDKDKNYLEKLSVLIKDLYAYVENSLNEIHRFADPNNTYKAFNDISGRVNLLRRKAKEDAIGLIRGKINAANLTDNDIKAMKAGTKTEVIRKIENDINNAILPALNENSIKLLDVAKQAIGDEQAKKVNGAIQSIQAKITAKTEEVKESVKNSQSRNVQEIMKKFSTPEFPSSVSSLRTAGKGINVNLDHSILSRAANNAHSVEQVKRTGTRKRDANGFWEWIRFWNDYYEEYTYTVDKDVYDIEKFKREIESQMQKRTDTAIDNVHDLMEEALKKEIRGIFLTISNECDKIGDSYKKLYGVFKEDIDMAKDSTNAHRQALLRDIGIFNEIKSNLQPFFSKWNEILHG